MFVYLLLKTNIRRKTITVIHDHCIDARVHTGCVIRLTKRSRSNVVKNQVEM